MDSRKLRRFRLYWLDGKTEIVEGDGPADAMNRAGYGGGAVRALDYYEEINEEDRPESVTAVFPKPDEQCGS